MAVWNREDRLKYQNEPRMCNLKHDQHKTNKVSNCLLFLNMTEMMSCINKLAKDI